MAGETHRMGYVRELEGLRGLMALWVALGHWAASLPIHIPVSQSLLNIYAVYVFVLLSGFVIAFLIENGRESYPTFIVRRALRLAPAYLIYLAISTALIGVTIAALVHAPPTVGNVDRLVIARDGAAHPMAHFVLHAFGVHALVPPRLLPNAEYALLGQAWSISLEWQFYLVAPAMILLLKRAYRPGAMLAIAGVAVAALALTSWMPRGFIGNFVGMFAIGIGSYFLLDAQHRGRLPASPAAYRGAAVLILALLVMQRDWAMLPYLIWVGIMAVLLVNRTGPLRVTRAVSRLLEARPVEMLGRLSYSLYLSHMIFLTLGMRLLDAGAMSTPAYAALLLAIMLGGTLILSWLVYRLVEMPCIRWGKTIEIAGHPARSAG